MQASGACDEETAVSHRPKVMIAMLLSIVLLPFAATAIAAQPSRSTIVSESATLDPATGQVTFVIEFNQRPDFYATDGFGRAENSFQYFIGVDPSVGALDSVVRGEEVHFTNGLVVIRNAAPEDDGTAQSGGWGTVRGQVPYKLNGPRLRFSVPLSLLTGQAAGNPLRYVLESYEFGGLISSVAGSIR
jgi:hypothetical protein